MISASDGSDMTISSSAGTGLKLKPNNTSVSQNHKEPITVVNCDIY